MNLGPVEVLMVTFPGNQFKGEIVPALQDLVANGTIRIIDIVFIRKNQDGSVKKLEINDLDDDMYSIFDPVVSDITGLLSEEDVQQMSRAMENNSSAGIMLFENTWATRLRDAILNANGQVVLIERIPRQVIDTLLEAQVQPVSLPSTRVDQ